MHGITFAIACHSYTQYATKINLHSERKSYTLQPRQRSNYNKGNYIEEESNCELQYASLILNKVFLW